MQATFTSYILGALACDIDHSHISYMGHYHIIHVGHPHILHIGHPHIFTGMEHHVLKMSWPEGCPPLNKIQSMARTKRYQVLLGACSKHRLRYLFTAHHMDDNNGICTE